MVRLSYFIFFLIGIFGSNISAQQSDLSAEVIQSIKDRIEAGINPSIAIGVIDKNGPRYYSFGKKSNKGGKVDEHTIYEIGSISKTFTAILLAQMVVEGQMKLDDPIEDYLPKTVKVPSYGGKKITLGHLSDHTSSLPRLPSNMVQTDPSNPYADYTVEQMYSFLSGYELTREIGSEYEYSNYAQGLLGHILALHANKSYEQLMIDVIAKPLKMANTKIVLDKKMRKNLAIGHAQGVEVSNWDLPTLAGAGAIRSSVRDMLLYIEANLGLKKSGLKPAMDLTHTLRHDKGEKVGLAWHLIEAPNGENFLAHNGGTGGYRTFTGISLEKGKGVVVFTNSSDGADDIGRHLMYPESPLNVVKPRVATEIRKAIDQKGIEDAVALYNDLKDNKREEYDFNEQELNGLGYHYLGLQKTSIAESIFKMIVETFPNSSNAYDSYGEALMMNDQPELAIENYKKSVELNPANTNAVDMLAKMGVTYEVKDFIVNEEVLEQLVGKYQLQPSFHIDISRTGNQLFGKATGQGKFELFAKSNEEFYLKVVDARILFSKDDSGEIESLTLFQAGQEMLGKKVE